MEAFLFYSFALLAILGALGVILLRQPVRSLLALILTMLSLAVLFLLLQAPFVAMVHIVVYAGAVLVLFLFVIMLLGIGAREPRSGESLKKVFVALAFFVPGAFLMNLLYLFSPLVREPSQTVPGSPESFGRLLFTHYPLPFELVSFLLLIGVFAAVTLVSSRKI